MGSIWVLETQVLYVWLSVNDFSAGLELPKGARNRRKATVKIRTNPQLRILPLIQNLYYKYKE